MDQVFIYPTPGSASYYAVIGGYLLGGYYASEDKGIALTSVITPVGGLDYIQVGGVANAAIRQALVTGEIKFYTTGNPPPPGGETRPPLPADTKGINYQNYQELVAKYGTGLYVPPLVVPSQVP